MPLGKHQKYKKQQKCLSFFYSASEQSSWQIGSFQNVIAIIQGMYKMILVMQEDI